MGNVLTDGNGNVLISNNNALEVTSTIDSNIQAGNIKKDVTILGVTGTYEGSGGSTETTFYSCTSTPQTLRGSRPDPGPEPGTRITFYVQYPNNNDKIPDMFIFYDEEKTMTNDQVDYGILSQTLSLSANRYGTSGASVISITGLTSNLLTLEFYSPYVESFDITKFQFAPIYLST